MSTKSLVSRKKILELEKTLINNTNNVNIISDYGNIIRCNEFPLKHSFADGIYIRQMGMSKDSLVVGAVHNHLHAWFLLTGKITVIIYAIEESIFVNIHKNPSNTQDLDELEAEIVSKNYKEYEKYINQKK